MFINQNIVAVVFRLINFFALIGLFVYLFKKHAMPEISFAIDKETADQDLLHTQQASLERKQAALDTLLKEEILLCQQFKIKIDEWNRIVAQNNEQHEQKRSHDLIALKKRIRDRAEQIAQDRIQNQVINAVAIDTEKALIHHFSQDGSGTQYLNEILDFMNERIQ